MVLYSLLTVVFYGIFKINPLLAEVIYGGMIYAPIRNLFDISLGLLPFPVIYIILCLVVVWFALTVKLHRSSYKAVILHVLRNLLVLFLLFFWLWGFNYLRPNIKTKLSLEIPEVNISLVEDMYCQLASELPPLREASLLSSDVDISNQAKSATKEMFDRLNLPRPGRPQVRGLQPKGVLLGISTAGIFIPYALEAHYDAGLHKLSSPFVMCHELAHAYGVTDEGECNFLASITCRMSHFPKLKYAGGLSDLKYFFATLVRAGYDPELLRSYIDESVLNDLKEIREKHDGYPTYFPDFLRNLIYDSYLKSQGVKSGLQSYGEVVGLLVAWELRTGSGPVLEE